MNDHFADGSSSVRDHGDGNALDPSLPDDARLRVPPDLDMLPHSEPANFRLVEISAHALMVQIGHLKQQFAGLNEFGCPSVEAVDRARYRRVFRCLRHALDSAACLAMGLLLQATSSAFARCQFGG